VVIWTEQPLGERPDGVIARELGVCPSTVTKARQRLGISHFQKELIDWDAVLGEGVTDAAVAKQLGVSRETVRRNRVRLGIAKKDRTLGVDWDLEPLGELQDRLLAKRLNVSEDAVKQARTRRGIAGFTRRPDWDRGLLGKLPDSAIARKFGISKTAVGNERKKHGIPRADLLCLTTEGEPANQEEALVDLYWHSGGIPHEFQVPIGPYLADWVIHGKTVVEYAGFANHPVRGTAYRARVLAKKAYYEGLGWETLLIWPEDLHHYETGLLPRFRTRDRCDGCLRQFGSRTGFRGGLVRRATVTLCDPCWRKNR